MYGQCDISALKNEPITNHDIRWCLLQSVCMGNTASSVIFVIKSLYYYFMLYLILNVWETYYFLPFLLEMLFLMPYKFKFLFDCLQRIFTMNTKDTWVHYLFESDSYKIQ